MREEARSERAPCFWCPQGWLTLRFAVDLHKYRMAFQVPKGDAGQSVEPYMRNLEADRVCRVAVSSHQMGRGPVARRRAAGLGRASSFSAFPVTILANMPVIITSLLFCTPLSVVIHAVES